MFLIFLSLKSMFFFFFIPTPSRIVQQKPQALHQKLREAHVVELANCQASAAFEATTGKVAEVSRQVSPPSERTTSTGRNYLFNDFHGGKGLIT